jgi:hypothetical protein
MKFGSKGLDAPTIIGIIVAIIVAIVIIYILWSRGMLPFAPAADRNLCLSEILDACAGTKDLSEVNQACTSFKDIAKPFTGDEPSNGQEACWACIKGITGLKDQNGCKKGNSYFQSCCDYIRGLRG